MIKLSREKPLTFCLTMIVIGFLYGRAKTKKELLTLQQSLPFTEDDYKEIINRINNKLLSVHVEELDITESYPVIEVCVERELALAS